MATLVWEAEGTYYWTCPPGCFTVDIAMTGVGGKGGSATHAHGCGGGGGGAYAATAGLAVIPGRVYALYLGSKASVAPSTFKLGTTTLVAADHGENTANNTPTGSAGGTVANSVGTIRYAGGAGGNGVDGVGGGGGGESASAAGDGNAGAAGDAGGAGGTGTDGGDGGAGRQTTNGYGSNAVELGGGGGGALSVTGSAQLGGTPTPAKTTLIENFSKGPSGGSTDFGSTAIA